MEEIPQQNRESRTCPRCPRKVIFDDIDSLNVHMGHCQKERPFQCKLCGWGFRAKKDLTGHEKTHNRGPKSISCSLCKKKFHTRKDLWQHEHVHQKAKFICADCGWSFRSKAGLTAHCLKHLGLKPFKCSECQREFSYASQRNQHQLGHKVVRRFACADCGKSYGWKQPLMKHVLEHLQIRYGCSLKRRDSRRFCCDDCGKVYRWKASLMDHVKGHFGVKFRCNLCGKQFLSQRALWKHKRTLHGPNGSLTRLSDGTSRLCPHCPNRRSKFADSESLKAHIAICPVQRPFACDGCQLRFREKRTVLQHQRIVHEKIRFICDDCGRSFLMKWRLQQHLFNPSKKGDCPAATNLTKVH